MPDWRRRWSFVGNGGDHADDLGAVNDPVGVDQRLDAAQRLGEPGIGGIEHVFLDRSRLGLDDRQDDAFFSGDLLDRSGRPQHVGDPFAPDGGSGAEEEAEQEASRHHGERLLGILGQRRRSPRNDPRALDRNTPGLDRIGLLEFLQRVVVEVTESLRRALELPQLVGRIGAAEQLGCAGGELGLAGRSHLIFVDIGIGNAPFLGLDRGLQVIGLTLQLDGDLMLAADARRHFGEL